MTRQEEIDLLNKVREIKEAVECKGHLLIIILLIILVLRGC